MTTDIEYRSKTIKSGIICLIIGSLVIYGLVKYHHFFEKEYVTAPCKISAANFSINAKSYAMDCEFSYEYKGETYHSDKFMDSKIFSNSEDIEKASAVERAFLNGGIFQCYIDKENPQNAFLVKPVALKYFKWGLAIFAGLLLVMSVSQFSDAIAGYYTQRTTSPTLFFFALVFGISGSLVIYFFMPEAKEATSVSKWLKTPAVIDHRFATASKDAEGNKSYQVNYLYRYRVNNKLYRSSRFELVDNNKSRDEAKALLKKYHTGKAVNCYVDPENPHRAVISTNTSTFYIFTLVPTSFIMASFICLMILKRRITAV